MTEIKNKIVTSLRRSGFDRVSRVPLEAQAIEFLSEQRSQKQIDQIKRYVPDLR